MSEEEKNKISKKNAKEVKMIPITVRFSESAYKTISFLAQKNGMSIAQVVRACTDDRVLEYLNSVVIINSSQARDIQDRFFALSSELEQIRVEINRIGINYNQEIRMMHIANRNGEKNIKSVFNGNEYIPVLNKMQKTADRIGQMVARIMGMR